MTGSHDAFRSFSFLWGQTLKLATLPRKENLQRWRQAETGGNRQLAGQRLANWEAGKCPYSISTTVSFSRFASKIKQNNMKPLRLWLISLIKGVSTYAFKSGNPTVKYYLL